MLKRWLKILGILVLSIPVVLMFGLAVLQRWILFPAPLPARMPSSAVAELLRIPSPDGPIVALYAPPPSAGAAVMVVFHGNGEQLADMAEMTDHFHRAGLGVLAMEYPGYGLAAEHSSASEDAFYRAAETTLAYLRGELDVPKDRTVLFGHSLGSGTAIEMAARGHGARVVLVAPFTSVPDMARRLLPFFPAAWIVRDRFDNASKAGRVTSPVLIVHGTRDVVVPMAMGRALAALFPHATTLWVEGGDHSPFTREALAAIADFARGQR